MRIKALRPDTYEVAVVAARREGLGSGAIRVERGLRLISKKAPFTKCVFRRCQNSRDAMPKLKYPTPQNKAQHYKTCKPPISPRLARQTVKSSKNLARTPILQRRRRTDQNRLVILLILVRIASSGNPGKESFSLRRLPNRGPLKPRIRKAFLGGCGAWKGRNVASKRKKTKNL